MHNINACAMLMQIGKPSASNTRVSWPLMAVTVKSEDDLAALRLHLGPYIDYLEADLRVFSTIRGLKQGISASNGICVTGCDGWTKATISEQPSNQITKDEDTEGTTVVKTASSVASW
jgi:hypothetical protein